MKLLKKVLNVSILFVLILFTSSTFIFANNTTIPKGNSTNVDEVNTYSPICLIMESKTGKVIYNKNGYEKAFPASTTKIMTAILAIENCELTDKATASYNAIFTVPYDYTNANIHVGEELTINQLLHVLLIPSANDAANVLAEHIAGSIESFATMMNTKAEELGCINTHFVNANGLHDENHYSTAYDLALMGRYAMKYDIFRKIVATSVYTLPATNKYAENDRVFGNTNYLIRKNDSDGVDNYYYEYANGIKTGYTNAAHNCLVASAKKNDKEYIVVILGASTTENGLSERFLDSKALFEYAFNNYTTKTIYESNSVLKTIKIKNGNIFDNNLDVVIQDEISPVTKNDTNLSNINPTIEIESELKAPIVKNTVIGKITYIIDGNEYTSNLIAGKDIQESRFFNILFIIIALIFIIFLLKKLLMPKNKKGGKYKKRKAKYYSNNNYN